MVCEINLNKGVNIIHRKVRNRESQRDQERHRDSQRPRETETQGETERDTGSERPGDTDTRGETRRDTDRERRQQAGSVPARPSPEHGGAALTPETRLRPRGLPRRTMI